MDKKISEIIQETINHHQKMFDWVEKQNPDAWSDDVKMVEEINRRTSGYFCPLCREFKCSNSYYFVVNCPLAVVFGECGSSNTNKYISYNGRFTNSKWLKGEKKFIKQLNELKEIYEDK